VRLEAYHGIPVPVLDTYFKGYKRKFVRMHAFDLHEHAADEVGDAGHDLHRIPPVIGKYEVSVGVGHRSGYAHRGIAEPCGVERGSRPRIDHDDAVQHRNQ